MLDVFRRRKIRVPAKKAGLPFSKGTEKTVKYSFRNIVGNDSKKTDFPYCARFSDNMSEKSKISIKRFGYIVEMLFSCG